MKKGIIDRFEGNYALVEIEDNIVTISIEKLPIGLKEGDVISISDKGVTKDESETEKRRHMMKKLMEELLE